MSTASNRRSAEHLELTFEIYSLIPTTRQITAKEIHNALADKGIVRAKRTVQRCLDSLLSYFDIEQDTRSMPYGYRRKVSSKLTFGPREHMMFMLAEASLNALLPKPYHLALRNAFRPLRLSAPERVLVDIRTSQSEASNTLDSLVFETLCTAVFCQREIRLSLYGEVSSLYVNPLGFVFECELFYLAYQYQHIVHLIEISSIRSAYLTTFEFTYPNDFHLAQTRNLNRIDNLDINTSST